MSLTKKPRIAIIGMGGYAGRHHEAVLALEALGECRLVSTCDPGADAFADKITRWRLRERGVAMYADYLTMLDRHAGELDVVIIPTPIPLHAEMHAAVVERGLCAYLEKPPTLDPEELERMIAKDAAARVPTLVGFNFIAEPLRQELKARVVAGEFGALHEVGLFGFWARSSAYYGRSAWAGKLVGADGRLILDSCMGNGLSHHVHNLLHWAGVENRDDWASPTRVRARLSRAHGIEGADTCFVEAETNTGVGLRIAISHACSGPEVHRESLSLEKAEIEYVTNEKAEVRWRDGRVEQWKLAPFDAQMVNLRALFECLKETGRKPPTTLVDSRAFVHLHALAYVSAGRIDPFAETSIRRSGVTGPGAGYLVVEGLEGAARRFLNEALWPGEIPRTSSPAELGKLDETVRAMLACATPV